MAGPASLAAIAAARDRTWAETLTLWRAGTTDGEDGPTEGTPQNMGAVRCRMKETTARDNPGLIDDDRLLYRCGYAPGAGIRKGDYLTAPDGTRFDVVVIVGPEAGGADAIRYAIVARKG